MKTHGACSLILGVSLTLLASFRVCAEDAWHGLPMAAPESVGMSSERLDRVGEAMQRLGSITRRDINVVKWLLVGRLGGHTH